jgi:hypothetical protein
MHTIDAETMSRPRDWWLDDAGGFKYRNAHLLSPAQIDASVWLGFFPPYSAETTYFGIELELICDDIDNLLAQWADADVLQRYYMVNIELTVENGLEFISAPMTLLEHGRRVPLLCHFLDRFALRTGEHTGMHVHISRNARTMERAVAFIAQLQDAAQEMAMDSFAGRPATHYCGRCFDATRLESLVSKRNAVRCTPHTIEIRIFRSTSDARTIMHRLERLHAQFVAA